MIMQALKNKYKPMISQKNERIMQKWNQEQLKCMERFQRNASGQAAANQI